MKQKQPTKKEITNLMRDLQQWQEDSDKAIMWHPGEPMVMKKVPDVSPELVAAVKKVITAFDAGTFPTLEELVEDPGSQTTTAAVLKELAKARDLVR